MNYSDVLDKVSLEALAEDGYNGEFRKVGLAFVDDEWYCVTDKGYHKAAPSLAAYFDIRLVMVAGEFSFK